MLVNILTAVLAQMPDVVVAGSLADGEDMAASIRATRSDIVMIQARRPADAGEFEPLLRQFPALKVVAIARGSRNGFVHELRLNSLPLPELSAEVLQTVLRPGPAGKPH